MSATGRPERELRPLLGAASAASVGVVPSVTGRPECELRPLQGAASAVSVGVVASVEVLS